MAAIVLLLSTIGSWLLFVGPVYQAALELRDYDAAVARVRQTVSSVAPPSPITWWWWLLPPVKMVLEWRRVHAHRQKCMDVLTVEQCEALVAYFHKATGWGLVGVGGLFLAIAQSYSFAQQHRIGDAAFAGGVAALTMACVVGCALRFRTAERFIDGKRKG